MDVDCDGEDIPWIAGDVKCLDVEPFPAPLLLEDGDDDELLFPRPMK